MRRIATLLILGSLAFTGCASSSGTGDFSRKVNQVQAGTSKQEVEKALGRPDEKKTGVAGVQRPGPQPPLTVNAGSRYEDWIYRRGDTEYHVFMGPSVSKPGHWVVHSVSAHPKGAVGH